MSELLFFVGLLIGGLASYFWFYFQQQAISSHKQQLQQKLTDAEQKNHKLMLQLADIEGQKRQIETYKSQLQQKHEELQRVTEKLASADQQIAALREESAAAKTEEKAAMTPETASKSEAPAPDRTEAAKSVIEPDDLRKIQGIGPRVGTLLNNAGILTFAQLAQTGIDRLHAILEEAGPPFKGMDPKSWPEQAILAAKGDWDGLKAFQEQLKAS